MSESVEQESANFFCEGSDSKHFRFFRPCGLVASKQPQAGKQEWGLGRMQRRGQTSAKVQCRVSHCDGDWDAMLLALLKGHVWGASIYQSLSPAGQKYPLGTLPPSHFHNVDISGQEVSELLSWAALQGYKTGHSSKGQMKGELREYKAGHQRC